MSTEPRRDDCPVIVTRPPTPPGGPIFFSEEDSYLVRFPHNDALVVTVDIRYYKVSKTLIDGGSSVNILYGRALDQMEDTPELT